MIDWFCSMSQLSQSPLEKKNSSRTPVLCLWQQLPAKKPQAQFFTILQLLPGHGAGYENCSLQLFFFGGFYHHHPRNNNSVWEAFFKKQFLWQSTSQSSSVMFWEKNNQKGLFIHDLLYFYNKKKECKNSASSPCVTTMTTYCHWVNLKMSMKCIIYTIMKVTTKTCTFRI